MLQNIRAKIGARLNGDKEAGFTLIELLVVMLILGILAAIALPAFFNQKDKAGDAKAKEYAHSAQVALETYFTDNNTYTNEVSLLEEIEPTLASADLTVTEGDTDVYKIDSESSNGNHFYITNTGGDLSFTCETDGEGGCPKAVAPATEGDWGG
ncbi:MAG: type IV pilin protein [Solirubrobacterales bacterium]